jgi:hypothetical protein
MRHFASPATLKSHIKFFGGLANNDLHTPCRRRRRSYTVPTAQTLVEFGKSQTLWIFFREPPADLGGLRIGQAQPALVLLFHDLDHVRDIGLSFRRPGQHSIENFFHLIFGHYGIIVSSSFSVSPPVRGFPASWSEERRSAMRLAMAGQLQCAATRLEPLRPPALFSCEVWVRFDKSGPIPDWDSALDDSQPHIEQGPQPLRVHRELQAISEARPDTEDNLWLCCFD